MMYTWGPLVYTGDYNGTLVAVCIFKGGPCVQMTWSLALIDVISDETLQDALFID